MTPSETYRVQESIKLEHKYSNSHYFRNWQHHPLITCSSNEEYENDDNKLLDIIVVKLIFFQLIQNKLTVIN